MIYFDNAATSRIKPESVYDAFNYYVREIGTSPGRGSYSLAIQASRMLYQTRKAVASFFDSQNPSNVVFTKNSTEAINLFFYGSLKQGDHVLISPYEHNAVLRPLHTLKMQGIIDYTVLPESAIYSPKESLCKFVKPNTKLLAVTLASNVTGQVIFSSALSTEAHSLGVRVFLDASQGAGKRIVNMDRDGIDVLAFTSHKDLLALPGVGGLVSLAPLRLRPLIQGGTGIHGEEYVNPDAFPESYEAGTLNMPAIWSLKAALEYIVSNFAEIEAKENSLLASIMTKLIGFDGVCIYKLECERVPTFSFNVNGIASSDIVRYLDEQGIFVRGGIHCAVLAHETLGTLKSGAVRVSLNYSNSQEEINNFIYTVGGLV